ncbi:MAG: AP-3 complex subunit beta, partial [Marteilia pararefringens]
MTQGEDCSKYFVDLVKIIYSKNFEYQLLLSIYLANYSHLFPQKSILAVQHYIDQTKTLMNPWRTSLALRNYTNLYIDFSSFEFLSVIDRLKFSDNIAIIKSCSIAMLKVTKKCPTLRELCVKRLAELVERSSTNLQIGTPLYSFCLLARDEELHLLHKSYMRIVSLIPMIEYIYLPVILNKFAVYCRMYFNELREDQIKIDANSQISNLDYEDANNDDAKECLPNNSNDHLIYIINSVLKLLKHYHFTTIIAASEFLLKVGNMKIKSECCRPLMRVCEYTHSITLNITDTLLLSLMSNPDAFDEHLSYFLYNISLTLENKYRIIYHMMKAHHSKYIIDYLSLKFHSNCTKVENLYMTDILFKILLMDSHGSDLSTDAVKLLFEILNGNNQELYDMVIAKFINSVEKEHFIATDILLDHIYEQFDVIKQHKYQTLQKLVLVLIKNIRKIPDDKLWTVFYRCCFMLNSKTIPDSFRSIVFDLAIYLNFCDKSPKQSNAISLPALINYLLHTSLKYCGVRLRYKLCSWILFSEKYPSDKFERYTRAFIHPMLQDASQGLHCKTSLLESMPRVDDLNL